MKEQEFRAKMRKLSETERQARQEREAFAKWFVEHGDDPEPQPFDFVELCRALVKDHHAAKKKHAAEAVKIKSEYRDERLKKELAAHAAAAPDDRTAIAQVNAHAKIFFDFLNEKEAAAMRDPAIDEPFKWLSRPVTLSSEDIQQLHDSNCDNRLFCQALREYVAARPDHYGVDLDLRDSISIQRELVQAFTKSMTEYIRDIDDWNFNFAEASGYFEGIKERLRGHGLFAQPKVIEQETPTPEQDGFTQAFTGDRP